MQVMAAADDLDPVSQKQVLAAGDVDRACRAPVSLVVPTSLVRAVRAHASRADQTSPAQVTAGSISPASRVPMAASICLTSPATAACPAFRAVAEVVVDSHASPAAKVEKVVRAARAQMPA
jgi:hypothetical protein